MRSNLFEGSTVRGLPLLDFLDWALSSQTQLDDLRSSSEQSGERELSQAPRFGLLALPPVQRSAVWRPKQVVDLWDSLFHGLPIGSMFLLNREVAGVSTVRSIAGTGRTFTVTGPGFDLFDGQQRTRAMLLGLCGPELDRRCLWVDLDPKSGMRLRLSTESQPFGYDSTTGRKLGLGARRDARVAFDKIHGSIQVPGQTRPAYDHELFEVLRARNGNWSGLPKPHGSSSDTYRLDELLEVWRVARRKGNGGREALLTQVGPAADGGALDTALMMLDASFERIEKAEIALILIDPHQFRDGADETRRHESMLMLFDRIGAGGTPLSAEERLFSILKHHEPRAHDVVLEIHQHPGVGRVMAPTRIVATALRLANALSRRSGNGVPDVAAFAHLLRATDADDFVVRLEELLPIRAGTDSAAEALLTRAFGAVRALLEYEAAANPLGLPRVALAELSSDLWQVLLLWTVRRLRAGDAIADLESSRADVVRFALFWRLCVHNEGRAAWRAYEWLRHATETVRFPGRELYAVLTGDTHAERCAHKILPAYAVLPHAIAAPASATWRSHRDRFYPDGAPEGYAQLWLAWWRSGRTMLPWLQRTYLAQTFPAYDPLSDRDDDLPYDLDHICPKADWMADWRDVKPRLEGSDAVRRAMRDERWEVGNGIGNLRLVEGSVNRADGDASIRDKLPCLAGPGLSTEAAALLDTLAFDPADRGVWLAASGQGRRWDNARLAAFQEAVERRAAWLYARFFETLRFGDWLDNELAEAELVPPDAPDEDLAEQPAYASEQANLVL